jgi:hypothetical protein
MSIAPPPPAWRYRSTSTRDRAEPGAAAKDERGSTQPEMFRARMRRHVPRDSPSWTRESGPIDATIRDSLLGAARTTTHPFETELTHLDELRGVGGAVTTAGLANGALTGEEATARAEVEGTEAECGVTSPVETVGGETFGTAEPDDTTLSRSADGARSRTPLAVWIDFGSGMVSTGIGVSATGVSVGFFVDATSLCFGRLSRSSQPVISTPHKSAMPLAFKTFGVIGAGSGFVPHQRHSPRLSG